ncbi:tetratricopeptide repeat protein [Oscillochloris sp. ZM17-4]|uniref:tetratricopeptide repeat protein n=1 Tax=Oscillochloris sp. ZM17-4 TaxID=2866714 RepID=UPI001C732017|nr:tetratricopeptide repeat protein [Oscillochloris sp. ZM17-4]MBX0330771.1 tetratricopeptide repeat protein [Oscillochloris sp. ZM17-4]
MDILHATKKTVVDSRTTIETPHWSRISTQVSLGTFLVLAFALTYFVSVGQLRISEAEASIQAASSGYSAQADHAIVIFEQSRRYHPDDLTILRRLADAYLTAGHNKEALSVLQEAFRLQPQDLVTQQALAEAYEVVGDTDAADAIWTSQGLRADRLLQLGRSYAAVGSYDEAMAWYQRALRAGLSANDLSLQVEVTIAAALAKASLPAELLSHMEALTHPVDVGLTLDGGELIWMPEQPEGNPIYGKPLNAFPSGNLKQGVFWWAGQAGTFLQVDQAGEYSLVVRAHHLPAPGGQLAVQIDSADIETITLGTAWQNYEMSVSLQPGTHLLRLRYLADVGDVFVQSITLNPIKH